MHWDYFLLLEEDLYEIFKYLEPVEDNAKAYGAKLAKLLLSVCSEVDVALKDLVGLRDPENEMLDRNSNIHDYRKFVCAEYINEFRCGSVTFARSDLVLRPWEEWWDESDKKDPKPEWWDAYNNVKHHQSESYHEANLQSLANAFAALFIVDVCIFREELVHDGPRELRMTKMTEFVDDGGSLGSSSSIEISDGRLELHNGFHAK